jgi:RHS repeat-associated protein
VALPVSVAPGQQYTFQFKVWGPSPGSYSLQWAMVYVGGNKWFGAITGSPVTVTENLGNVTYIHTDGLGSPVARTDAVGTVISRTRYEPYGYVASGATPTIGFAGHVNDADTGLTYMQQRYYDPVAGRFLSIDPVTTNANTGSSFNRYNYAENNPYRYVDPDGRGPVGWTLILYKNGKEHIGRALYSHAQATAARKAEENVVMRSKSGAAAVEVASNGGSRGAILQHSGHDLPTGGTGRPHYQTKGARGHTFWGKVSAGFIGFEEGMREAQTEIWEDIKSDPLGAICWLCSAGNEKNDSDKIPEAVVETIEQREANANAQCGVSCGIGSHEPRPVPNSTIGGEGR